MQSKDTCPSRSEADTESFCTELAIYIQKLFPFLKNQRVSSHPRPKTVYPFGCTDLSWYIENHFFPYATEKR